ncbi:MAG: parallel beta-helix repeat protein [Parvicellaceae bacterium]|jgi:parallel beta-helix repeat protein
MKAKIILIVLISLLSVFEIVAKDYNVIDFGAKDDGATLSTLAIQKAIDQASADGGGRVVIPKGFFLIGSLVLKNNVELHLEKKATLLGSTNPSDYLKINRWIAMIMADNAQHISITGKGIIDGQGYEIASIIDSLFYCGEVDSSSYTLKEKRPSVKIRPQIIEMVYCNFVNIKGITLKNAASWVQSYFGCTHLIIDNIEVESDTYWNNDGIDIIDCKNVRITNCVINSSDDGICLKSYGMPMARTLFCDSIYISNCVVRSSASAVKFGTASFGGFKNVTIEKIKVYDTFRSAIALESFGNAVLENIVIRDIKATNTGNAIFVRIGQATEKMVPGKISGLVISDVKVKIAKGVPDAKYKLRGPALPFFHNPFPASVTGLPNQDVEQITLKNITIKYPGGGHKAYANMPISRLDDVPENENHYPEFSMFGELPAWGFYIRHVNGLTMENIKMKLKKSDYRPAIVFDDVKKLKLLNYQITGDQKSNTIILHHTEGADIKENN